MFRLADSLRTDEAWLLDREIVEARLPLALVETETTLLVPPIRVPEQLLLSDGVEVLR